MEICIFVWFLSPMYGNCMILCVLWLCTFILGQLTPICFFPLTSYFSFDLVVLYSMILLWLLVIFYVIATQSQKPVLILRKKCTVKYFFKQLSTKITMSFCIETCIHYKQCIFIQVLIIKKKALQLNRVLLNTKKMYVAKSIVGFTIFF